MAMRIDADGELIWQHDYSWGGCLCVLELKSGDFILAGKWREEQGEYPDDSQIIRINGDGEPVWRRQYDYGTYDHIRSIREGDGEVVCAGYRYEGSVYPNIFKVDADNGDVIWLVLYEGGNLQRSYFDGLVSSGDGGFITVACHNSPVLVKLNGDGEIVWQRAYDNIGATYILNSIARMSEGGYTLGGFRMMGQTFYRPAVVRVNADGIFRWGAEYDLDQQGFEASRNCLLSVVCAPDDVIIGAGEVRDENNGDYNGLLMRLEPAFLGPRIVRFTPRDTTLTVLTGDTTIFSLFALGANEYRWFREDEQLEVSDTLCRIGFPETDESIRIRGTALNDDGAISVEWNVTVLDLFIVNFSPDTLDLFLRRSSQVEFSIDSVRCNRNDEIEYLWTILDLGTIETREISTNADVTLPFPFSGRYLLEGLAYVRDLFDSKVWEIEVRGAIWNYSPEASNLVVNLNDSIHFEIIPSIPDTTNRFDWYYDEVFILDEIDSTLTVTFTESGIHSITGVLSDSSDIDTVLWHVEVIRSNSNVETKPALPIETTLSAFPNPFNSTVAITFSTGRDARPTRLGVYDVQGRMVADFTSKIQTPNSKINKVVWDTGSVGAGVYFARLEAGVNKTTRKLVLVR